MGEKEQFMHFPLENMPVLLVLSPIQDEMNIRGNVLTVRTKENFPLNL